MPNLTSKKIKTINSSSLIKNQITNILQPVNGSISIKQPNNTILTQNAVSQNYYIPLLENTAGEQSITTRVPLSFNATTNTLSVPNLTISNLPTCNVDASNSSDLVRKSYANTYAYFDLSGGDRWYCEDWITGTIKGKYNWDISGSTIRMMNSTDLTSAGIDASNHFGIITFFSTNTNLYTQIKLPVIYSSYNMKLMRFIAHLSGGKVCSLGFKDNGISSAHAGTYNIYWSFASYGIQMVVNNNAIDISEFTTMIGKWFLFEISVDKSGIVRFYATNLTDNGNRVMKTHSTTATNFLGNIFVGQYATTSNNRYTSIDYIDWVVSS